MLLVRILGDGEQFGYFFDIEFLGVRYLIDSLIHHHGIHLAEEAHILRADILFLLKLEIEFDWLGFREGGFLLV